MIVRLVGLGPPVAFRANVGDAGPTRGGPGCHLAVRPSARPPDGSANGGPAICVARRAIGLLASLWRKPYASGAWPCRRRLRLKQIILPPAEIRLFGFGEPSLDGGDSFLQLRRLAETHAQFQHRACRPQAGWRWGRVLQQRQECLDRLASASGQHG